MYLENIFAYIYIYIYYNNNSLIDNPCHMIYLPFSLRWAEGGEGLSGKVTEIKSKRCKNKPFLFRGKSKNDGIINWPYFTFMNRAFCFLDWYNSNSHIEVDMITLVNQWRVSGSRILFCINKITCQYIHSILKSPCHLPTSTIFQCHYIHVSVIKQTVRTKIYVSHIS